MFLFIIAHKKLGDITMKKNVIINKINPIPGKGVMIIT
jgi:hypothetical protein